MLTTVKYQPMIDSVSVGLIRISADENEQQETVNSMYGLDMLFERRTVKLNG